MVATGRLDPQEAAPAAHYRQGGSSPKQKHLSGIIQKRCFEDMVATGRLELPTSAL